MPKINNSNLKKFGLKIDNYFGAKIQTNLKQEKILKIMYLKMKLFSNIVET